MAPTPSQSPQVIHIGISTPPMSPPRPPPRLLRHRKLSLWVAALLVVIPLLEIISLTTASWLVGDLYISGGARYVNNFRVGALQMCVQTSSRVEYDPVTRCYPFNSKVSISLAPSQFEVKHVSLCDASTKNEGLLDHVGISGSESTMKILDSMCGSNGRAVLALQIIAAALSGIALCLFVVSAVPWTKPRLCKQLEKYVCFFCCGALVAALVTQLLWMEKINPRNGAPKRGPSAHLNMVSIIMPPVVVVLVRRCTYKESNLPSLAPDETSV